MPTPPDTPILPPGRSSRFDWWQALVRVLSSIEAVRDGRAMYILLTAYAGAGTSMASAIRAYGQGNLPLAIGLGTAALFIAFYGSNAAGLMLMDRALGQPVRDPRDAVFDALGIGHRVALDGEGRNGALVGRALLGIVRVAAHAEGAAGKFDEFGWAHRSRVSRTGFTDHTDHPCGMRVDSRITAAVAAGSSIIGTCPRPASSM